MRVPPPSSPNVSTPPEIASDPRERLRMLILKKQLELQKTQAAEIVRQASGKGQVIDIRV